MTLFVSQASDTPIYSQIEEQIKSQILSGTLASGTPLPSMRILAKDLRVSVITVQKAYENLTRDGFITTGVGRGSFVAPLGDSFLKQENIRRVEEAVENLLETARRGGIDKKQVIEIVEKYFDKEAQHENS